MDDVKNEQCKLLYKTYTEFYKKNPNLDRDNIRVTTIEFQSMLYILFEFGIKLGDYGFVKYGYRDLTIPMSKNAQNIITTSLMDDVNPNDSEYELAYDYKYFVGLIGDIVNRNIEGAKDPIETLREVALISYFRNRIRPLRTDEEVIRLTNCKKEDIVVEKKIYEEVNASLEKEKNEHKNIRRMIYKKK